MPGLAVADEPAGADLGVDALPEFAGPRTRVAVRSPARGGRKRPAGCHAIPRRPKWLSGRVSDWLVQKALELLGEA